MLEVDGDRSDVSIVELELASEVSLTGVDNVKDGIVLALRTDVFVAPSGEVVLGGPVFSDRERVKDDENASVTVRLGEVLDGTLPALISLLELVLD